MGLFDIFKKKPQKINVDVSYSSKEIKVEKEIPPFQWDYAKTVFLDSFYKRPLSKNWNFALYFETHLGIADTNAYRKQMLDEGYLRIATNEEKLIGLKVTELKEILKTNSLSITGKKEDLIQRIVDNLPDSSYGKYVQGEFYILTEIGEKYVDEHSDLVLLNKHRNWMISYNEYQKEAKPGRSFYDVCWAIFNQRVLTSNMATAGTAYYNMYEIFVEEKKYEYAVETLLRVLYIDMCGTLGDGMSFIAPGLIDDLKKYKKYYKPDMIDKIYDWKVPHRYCRKEVFIQIIESVINGKFNYEKASSLLNEELERREKV